jgi:hypothetical protein
MVRLPLPPGGNARIRKAPQSGQSDAELGPSENSAAGPKSRQFKFGHSQLQNRPQARNRLLPKGGGRGLTAEGGPTAVLRFSVAGDASRQRH